ncbi:BTB/POZ protein [Hygrophoropsis aurantiaca]|uniref:BTB/POZ protein n=1 Tax=Hygrophoropsis aurantiaca TaxID=72124 RepID=A0ACB8A649_9AGAM|nr:BTB/POZ protein [Hygrophoropsis aurantiaca]
MPNDVEMNADKPSDWVRLTSSDGYSFLIKRKVAMMSGTLKNMLSVDSNFKEALANTCPINERYASDSNDVIIQAAVVEKVCEYMSFKAHHESAGPKEEIPVNEFTERIPPEVALEL